MTAVALLLGGILTSGTASTKAAAVALAPRLDAPAGGSLVPQLQEQVRANPDDVHGLALLGLAYQQRARETGNPSYYTKSQGVLARAVRLVPDDLLATGGLGALALSRHRFRAALSLGRRALAISPSTARGHGIVGDALVELGRYEEAFAAFNRMASLKPGLASYARVSYARELTGDVAGAREAMQLALDAALGQPEALAWTHTQLGKLYWSQGRIRAAELEYQAALAAYPGYVFAVDGLAQVEAARGRLQRAISLDRRAAEAIPLPQFVGALRDLYEVSGRTRAAQRQNNLIGAIERLLNANGVRTDLETALFDVDHAVRLPHALVLARSAWRERPSIDGDDVLAWALARNGRCGEALRFSKRALRLGTLDASKFFHRGMIERCLGHSVEAKRWFHRALDLNPYFSLLWAPVARKYAA